MSDAISVVSDFKVYEAEFNLGFFEALYKNTNIFNAASNGAIQMISQVHTGNYFKTAFFSQIASLVVRQDIASTADVDSKKLSQAEEIGVKLHRRIGPVQSTYKAFAMSGVPIDTKQGSMILGRMLGDALAERMANDAVIAAVGAVNSETDLINDITALTTKYATIKGLNRTRLKFGDQFSQLAAWIMRSENFGDLVEDGLDIPVESLVGAFAARGTVPSLMNAGMVITDNANLVNTGTPNTYNVLGLKPGAVTVMQSELNRIVIREITGKEQLTFEMQGEYANTVMVDGFAWNTSTGGANPTDANLGSSSYWSSVRTNVTGLPIVKMLCQEKS